MSDPSMAVATIDQGVVGLEDFDDTTDMVMPRLTIVQKEALFKDGLTGEQYDALSVVWLGLVKQRILWSPEVGSNDGPLCKSLDFNTGFPQGTDVEKERDGHLFPWKSAGFAPADHPDLVLPCEACRLKEWGSNPKNDSPWCSEQHVIALLMETEPGVFEMPALLTLQRSNIKASRAYLTSYRAKKQPTFVAQTHMSLTLQKRGDVEYSTINLVRGAATDPELHPDYATRYRAIRDTISSFAFDEAQQAAEEKVKPDPGPTSAPAQPAPAMPSESDEIPF